MDFCGFDISPFYFPFCFPSLLFGSVWFSACKMQPPKSEQKPNGSRVLSELCLTEVVPLLNWRFPSLFFRIAPDVLLVELCFYYNSILFRYSLAELGFCREGF